MSGDPRTHLPVGAWTVVRTRTTPPTASSTVASFWLVGSERATADRVRAYVTIDDLAGYTHAEWGLPAAPKPVPIYYLARIVPRLEKARGGTVAVVHFLAEIADRDGRWLATEVKTDSAEKDQIVMALLGRRADFVSPDPEFAGMMVRRPR